MSTIVHRTQLTGPRMWQLLQNYIFFMTNRLGSRSNPLILYAHRHLSVNIAPTNQVEIVFNDEARYSYNNYNNRADTVKKRFLRYESDMNRLMRKSLEFFAEQYYINDITEFRGNTNTVDILCGLTRSPHSYERLTKRCLDKDEWFWVKPDQNFTVTFHELYLLYMYFKQYKSLDLKLSSDECKQINDWLANKYDVIVSEFESERRKKLNIIHKRYQTLMDMVYVPHTELTTIFSTIPNANSKSFVKLKNVVTEICDKSNATRAKLVLRREKQIASVTDKYNNFLNG